MIRVLINALLVASALLAIACGSNGGAQRDAGQGDPDAGQGDPDAGQGDPDAGQEDTDADTNEEVDGGSIRRLGSVTASGPCELTTALADATCEQVTVACPGLDDATLALIVGEPADGVAVKGTIVFGSGSAGASPMEQAAGGRTGETYFISELEALRADGYRVVERAWRGDAQGDRGWIRGASGPDDSACRYATAMTWLHERFDADGAFCAVGFSGGSMELAMGLGPWQRASIIDYALFISGPITRFDQGCIGGDAWQSSCDAVEAAHPWQCGVAGVAALSCVMGDNIALLLDTAYAGATTCSSRSPANASVLARDSPLPPPGHHSLLSSDRAWYAAWYDCASGAATHGAHYATLVTGKNGKLSDHLFPIADAGHVVHATQLGTQKMGELLRAGCLP